MVTIEALRATLEPLPLGQDELRELAEALSRRPRPAIRLRPGLEPHALPFAVESTPWHENGNFVTDGGRPGAQLPYAAGDYYIQEAGSLLAVSLLDARPGQRICDLCASPGGKATAILETLGGDGWLLANETIRSRIGVLQLNLSRHGSTRYAVSPLDPGDLAERLGPVFDAVLVDAPCSGQSLVARGRQTESAFSARTVEHCAARQARVLDAAARLVAPGGRLVYATCTFSYRENEAQLEQFLCRHPDWAMQPSAKLDRWQSNVMPGCYRLWPHRDGCAGAFAAALRRLESGGDVRSPTPVTKTQAWQLRDTAFPSQASEWGSLKHASLLGGPGQCFAWPELLWSPLRAVARSGPELAYRKASTWFPAYALAMRRDPHWSPAAAVALDEHEALAYVGGAALQRPLRGWAVATWNGRPLGWLRGDGRQMKNHLPKAARLRPAKRT